MKIIERSIEKHITPLLFKGKAILLFGPRQVGKTTLAKKLIEQYGAQGAYFNCELVSVRDRMVMGKPELLHELVKGKKIVVLDEAQTILNIGSVLKTYLDTYPEVQIIATGSSSFDLANKINEPLTGRAYEFTLYPLSLSEIRETRNVREEELHELLRTGMYPGVVGERVDTARELLLRGITTNYLYKDIFIFESIRNPLVFENLIKLLAYQIGNLVSINELSKSLGVSRITVEKYIRLLEQSYIVKRIHTFSRNGRNELKKAFKVFFLDLGIRNAVIDALDPISERDDKGRVFENFVYLELLKAHVHEPFPPRISFWRTDTKYEVDFVVHTSTSIEAIEVKWQDEHVSFKQFLNRYPEAVTSVVTQAPFLRVEKNDVNMSHIPCPNGGLK